MGFLGQAGVPLLVNGLCMVFMACSVEDEIFTVAQGASLIKRQAVGFLGLASHDGVGDGNLPTLALKMVCKTIVRHRLLCV